MPPAVVENAMQNEALRSLHHAGDLLQHVPIEDDLHLDREPVRESPGTADFAVQDASNQGLVRQDVPNANSRPLGIATAAPCRSIWRFVTTNCSGSSTSSRQPSVVLLETNIVKAALKAAHTCIDNVH